MLLSFEPLYFVYVANHRLLVPVGPVLPFPARAIPAGPQDAREIAAAVDRVTIQPLSLACLHCSLCATLLHPLLSIIITSGRLTFGSQSTAAGTGGPCAAVAGQPSGGQRRQGEEPTASRCECLQLSVAALHPSLSRSLVSAYHWGSSESSTSLSAAAAAGVPVE